MESRPWRATLSRVTRTTAALLALLVALPASAMLLAAGPVAGYANGYALKSLPHRRNWFHSWPVDLLDDREPVTELARDLLDGVGRIREVGVEDPPVVHYNRCCGR